MFLAYLVLITLQTLTSLLKRILLRIGIIAMLIELAILNQRDLIVPNLLSNFHEVLDPVLLLLFDDVLEDLPLNHRVVLIIG